MSVAMVLIVHVTYQLLIVDYMGKDMSRRVLGLPSEIHGLSSINLEDTKNGETSIYSCPICGDEMVTLPQLNQHIDDAHNKEADPVAKPTHTPKKSNTPQRRVLELDLYENNSGFGLSENKDEANALTEELSRSHWVHPSSLKSNSCSYPRCRTALSIKNGIVNCRKCGKLYCNAHTRYRARLRNGKSPERLPEYDSVNGSFAVVCKTCYLRKPGIKMGTQVNTIDLTSQFSKNRRKFVEEKQLVRSITQKRFIKLINLLALAYLWHVENKSSFFGLLTGSKDADGTDYSPQGILDATKEIVGQDKWENDAEITHCKLCFVKFNLLIRKHHCRLCGSVVSDAAFNDTDDDPSRSCSVQVPAGLLLSKLDKLNYSPQVLRNWNVLTKVDPIESKFANVFSFRCCRTCKDQLLYTSREDREEDSENVEVLAVYGEILALKSTISGSMARYKHLIEQNDDRDNQQVNKIRLKLSKNVKDLETRSNFFKQSFFQLNPDSKKYVPKKSPVLVTNVYKAAIMFLQDSILALKQLNDKFQEMENAKLAGQLGLSIDMASSTQSPSPSTVLSPSPVVAPRLTKKQIRELREQLMVAREQKYLIENSIEQSKRLRKFDEFKTLEENRGELEKLIEGLEHELGEFGFEG